MGMDSGHLAIHYWSMSNSRDLFRVSLRRLCVAHSARSWVFIGLLIGCSCSAGSERRVHLDLPPIEVDPGQELSFLCQSYTLENERPLYINAVHMQTGPTWHHSNWFFVPEDVYDGPDGTWNCAERDFDTLESGLIGGVLFAQSTQATAETQRFPEGAGVVIPPRSRIVGEVHLLNASDTSVSSNITLELETLTADEFTTPLHAATLLYTDLDMPARQRSRFSTSCDLAEAYGGALDMRVYYVLPHYHALGEDLRIELMGGPNDGQVLYENASPIGEPLGGMLDPPIALNGADGVRFGCTFNNTSDAPVGWGIGDQEMCVALAFVDGPIKWAAGVQRDTAQVGSEDGVNLFEGPCDIRIFPAR